VSDPIVGIDLGTSNTVVAHAGADGVANVLADASGIKIHPSVVSFHPSGGVVVGAPAKQRKVIDPKNTIFSIKRLIGRGYNSKEVQTARQRMPYQIKEGANQLPLIVTRGGEFAIPELSAIVLDHARVVASTALKTEVSRAVVTVPASFNDAQRSATATAGSIAGISVVRVLNEPTAAALAYGNMRDLRQTIAVYDFGGGTFDITILKLADQVYEVLGTSGDSFLGGDDLDERLVDRMVDKFLAENRVDLRSNEVSMMRLRAVAEQTKIELSRRSRAVVRVDEIAYGAKGKALDLQIEIRREEFVSQVSDIIDKTFPVCEEALKLAGLTIDHIDDVILVGGTTKIPYVRDQVAKFFAKAPRTDVNPEDAVAVGAALQATALERILKRKSPSRAPEPAPHFDDNEVSFGGESAATTTLGGETFTDLGGTSGVTETNVLDRAVAELDLESPGVPPGRRTAPYTDTPKPPGAPLRKTERAVTRGEHKDVFEEKTPVPAAPAGPVLARMTKPGMPGASAPKKTVMGLPAVTPPPPPAPAGLKGSTAPRMTAARPPAVPSASPQSRTMMIEPERPSDASTVIVDPTSDDVGFPNIATEKGFLDLDDQMQPGATAKGFSPSPAASAPTLMGLPELDLGPQLGTTPARAKAPSQAPPPPRNKAPSLAPPPQAFSAPRAPAPMVLDVTPRGLGIGTVAGFCEELIRRNSRLPAEMKKMFSTSRDDQDAVRIIVVQGESRRLDSNTVIADLRLDNLPRRPRGETSIEVTFMIDANGMLQIRARDAQTGREQRASLNIVGSIAQEDVSSAREKIQALRR
jgi:molecular chaperone DnaK